jgi:hypothetical protein
VKHRDWAIDAADIDRAIDKNTRLVSLALVSNVNGFMHDAKAVGALAARARPYVFADIIQAVGAVPVDMRALGIDFACRHIQMAHGRTRDWISLRARRSARHRAPHDEIRAPAVANFNRAELTWSRCPARRRRDRRHPVILAACVSAGLAACRAARPREDPRARAPADRSPAERAAAARLQTAHAARHRDAHRRLRVERCRGHREALKAGTIAATIIANENRLRLGVSVFNTHEDIDRLVHALASS